MCLGLENEVHRVVEIYESLNIFLSLFSAAKRDLYLALENEVHLVMVNLAADAQQTLTYVSRALHLEARALTEAGDVLRQ